MQIRAPQNLHACLVIIIEMIVVLKRINNNLNSTPLDNVYFQKVTLTMSNSFQTQV